MASKHIRDISYAYSNDQSTPPNTVLVIRTLTGKLLFYCDAPSTNTAGGEDYFSFKQAAGSSHGGGQRLDGMVRNACEILTLFPKAVMTGRGDLLAVIGEALKTYTLPAPPPPPVKRSPVYLSEDEVTIIRVALKKQSEFETLEKDKPALTELIARFK